MTRINRFLASAGLGSRRACEGLVRAGKVTVNGRRCDNLATTVGPTDEVRVSGRAVRPEERVHLLLNKPPGLVCSADDERGRRTIFDLLPDGLPRLFHVGRLDMESQGLIVLTNDGELALRLTHPSHRLEKEYVVRLDREFDERDAARLTRGFHIEGGRARMESIRRIGPRTIAVTLAQGIKRQIRKMLYEVGYEVEELTRTRIGGLSDNRLRSGQWRHLSPRDLARIETPPRESARPPQTRPRPAPPAARGARPRRNPSSP